MQKIENGPSSADVEAEDGRQFQKESGSFQLQKNHLLLPKPRLGESGPSRNQGETDEGTNFEMFGFSCHSKTWAESSRRETEKLFRNCGSLRGNRTSLTARGTTAVHCDKSV